MLLPDEPAGQEAAAYQESARAEREQRGGCATPRWGACLSLSLLWRKGRGRGRSGLRRRGRGSLRRWGRSGLTRRLGHNTTGLRLYDLIRTVGLGLRTTGGGRLGLSI